MSPDMLMEHFDVVAEAPNGVQKLRELILQLAVRGKLVPQDANDEPTSVLLQRIANEKEQLQADALAKPQTLSSVVDNEIPFELPTEWLWVRWAQVATNVQYGYTASANTQLRDVRLLRITDIQNGRVDWDSVPGCEIARSDLPKYELSEGDLLIARTGGTLGKSYLVPPPTVRSVFASYLIRITPARGIDPRFMYTYASSPLYWQQLVARSAGTGQPNVNGTALSELLFPLPPLAEQRRIVVKVNELMTLCDELEERQRRRADARTRVNTSTLYHLTSAADDAELAEHWQRLCENFDFVYQTPEIITELRKAVLQLAVRGKLVPHDPNDEPATVLLERIALEKQRLMGRSEAAEPRPMPPFTGGELPFEVPQGWRWTNVEGLVSKLGSGSTPRGGKKVYTRTGVAFLRSQNVWNDGLRLSDVACIPAHIHAEMAGTAVQDGDVLLNITGASIGRSAVVPDAFGDANVSQHVLIMRPIERATRRFLHTCVISPYFQDLINQVQVGVSREGLSKARLATLPMPVPPLAEQRRIVARVDELMALCDELEGRLTLVRETAEHFAASVVHRFSGD